MRRRTSFALVAALTVVVVSGCAPQEATAPTAASPAPPQEAAVDWVEPAPADGDGLVFAVRTITVTADGWRAQVAIRNESTVSWETPTSASSRFGVMLFVTGELGELERRNASQDLPGLRSAREVEPALPAEIKPGRTWEGVLSAPGSLAADRWLRVVFGPLAADGDPPEGLPAQLVWITDNTYRLRR